MKIKTILEEDFSNYKKASMFIVFPFCSFKCDKECGSQVCQNTEVAKMPDINIDEALIVKKYMQNPITSAIVCGGLEPMDSINDLCSLIACFRDADCPDEFVIYTGYYEKEIQTELSRLKQFSNIIVKFGRFRPNEPHHIDPLLGVELASSNQYAKYIS